MTQEEEEEEGEEQEEQEGEEKGAKSRDPSRSRFPDRVFSIPNPMALKTRGFKDR